MGSTLRAMFFDTPLGTILFRFMFRFGNQLGSSGEPWGELFCYFSYIVVEIDFQTILGDFLGGRRQRQGSAKYAEYANIELKSEHALRPLWGTANLQCLW